MRSAQLLLVLALVAALVTGLREITLVVIPVLIAAIIAAAVSPVVRFLRRRGIPSGIATWLSMLLGAGGFALVVWFIVRAVRAEWDELVEAAQEGVDELQTFLTEGPLEIDEEQISDLRGQVTELLGSGTVQDGALAGASAAVDVAIGTVLAIVVLFFLLRDARRIWEFFLQPLGSTATHRARRMGDAAVDVLGGYVRGTAIVAFVDAMVIGIALVVLGIPLALPLATIVFIGAFIPLLGATVAGTLAALVALVSDGPGTALIVVAVVIAVNQLEGNLLEPVVLARTLSLHPLAVLLALTVGTVLAGIVGALLSVPMAAVAWAAVKAWSADDEPDDGEEGPADPQVDGEAAAEGPAPVSGR